MAADGMIFSSSKSGTTAMMRLAILSILMCAYEQAAVPSLFLLVRLIDRHGRRRNDIFVVEIGHHGNDAPCDLKHPDVRVRTGGRSILVLARSAHRSSWPPTE